MAGASPRPTNRKRMISPLILHALEAWLLFMVFFYGTKGGTRLPR